MTFGLKSIALRLWTWILIDLCNTLTDVCNIEYDVCNIEYDSFLNIVHYWISINQPFGPIITQIMPRS